MATAGNTYFLRSLLLLVEGALYITRQILEREIERKKGECNLKTLLTNCENKLKHQFHGKQYKKLFPEYDDPDIYKWDLQLSIGVLLNVFERTLTLTERKNLRSLKELRNEKFMHCASPSLDQQQYEDVQEELDDIITSLAATFDEHVKERCSSLILQFATGPLDGVKPSLATLDGFSQGCQKKFKVCVNTELVVGGPSEHWTNLCERILDTILNNADSVASAGADYEEIRTNVKKMLDFLQSNKDVVFKGSKMECVVLCFECDSYDDFLQFVEMFDMQELQAHLDRLSEALMRYYKLSSRVHISCRVRTESLQFALIDVIGEMCFNEKEIVNNTLEISTKKGNDETISLTRNMAGSDDELCNTEESKQSLSLELECTSREGLLHTLSSFQKEEFSDKLTSVADALSRHVRQNITLKASLNVQDVMEAIEESDVHHIYQEVKQEEIQYGDDNIVVKYKKALACELPERWIGIENEATKMADTQDSASISEAEIDQLTMPKAMRLCRDNQIKLEGSKELDKIKWLIKYQLLCQGKKREEAMRILSLCGNHDRTRREALSVLYENTTGYVQSINELKDPVIDELNKMFPDVCESLDDEKEKMLRDVAPVLVLGETGSGKSSFINLLLGADILPCSLLSNTHVICEIMYCGEGQRSKAILKKAGSKTECTTIDDLGDGEFTKELARHIQELDSNKRAVYRLAKIYLPCDILKSGLMIVDSPGIGETKEMTSTVLSYILNAAAFIYIIDSTNAGGMQARVKELVQKVYRQALEDQKICRPESAIFICNKWDEVSGKDREDVWEDTKRKVEDAWPECQESQIIRFSTVEAAFIQEKGRIAPKFETILKNINELVPIGQEVLVLRGYRFIEQFISRCIICFGAHLSELNLSMEDRETKRKLTKDRLNQLKSRITTFFDEQFKTLKADIDNIADNLKKFINEKENLDKVCKFSDRELPVRGTWNEAAVEVRRKVYESMRNLIKEWESHETQFGKIAKHIEDSIEKDFPAFDREIYKAEKLLSHSQQVKSVAAEETEIGLVPEFIENKIGSLSLGTKVALGIGLSPVILVGMIVRLPVYGVQAFDRFYSKYSLEKDFREAEGDKEKLKMVCEKYAKKTVASITDKMNMRQIIEEDMQPLTSYLKQQQKRMEKQIQCDLDLLKNLKDEDRKDEDVRKVYEPLNAKFMILRECLHHFMLIHLPAKFASWIEEVPFADIEVSDKLICSGLEANIFEAKSKPSRVTDGKNVVSVRVIKEKIKENKMKQFLTILEAYKTICRKNIAKCYGFWNPGVGSGMLYQVLEPLQCSLRQLTAGVDYQANHDNNCVRTMTELLHGLDFLHDRKLVHFDMSMDTVAVDARGKVKLTNISPEMRVNLQPEVVDGKVCISKYIHLDPKFYQNKGRVTYRIRDDMYGVGVIMWELWEGLPVVEIGKEFEIPETLLKRKSSAGSLKGRKDRGSKKKKRNDSGKVKSDESDTDEKFEWVDDEVWFQKYLETFRPLKTEEFSDEDQNREKLCEKWWETLTLCLDGNLTAKKWLELWNDYPKFPEVSIIFQDSHFSKDHDE